MRLTITIFSLALFCAPALHAQSSSSTTAISKLRQLRPAVKWDEASTKTADLDCDSKPDTVILGSEKGQVIVGVVWAAKRQPQVFVFPVRSDTQDGFCAVPRKIEILPLDCMPDAGKLSGCKVTKGCKAFSVNDGKCDPFNFYWNATQKKLAWWRM